jgi:predicted SAM-dependent methyltransferase
MNEVLNAGKDHNMTGEELDPFRAKHLKKDNTPVFESECAKLREYLAPYCKGCGMEVGSGGDALVPHAITMDMPDDKRYANVGKLPIQLKGDCRDLYWFRNGVLDFLSNSHTLEDFPNTIEVMKEWTRVLKIGGYLVLNLPHEMKYREHCEKTGQIWNAQHSIEEMSPEYIKECANAIPGLTFIYETPILYDYVFGIVFQKQEVK